MPQLVLIVFLHLFIIVLLNTNELLLKEFKMNSNNR